MKLVLSVYKYSRALRCVLGEFEYKDKDCLKFYVTIFSQYSAAWMCYGGPQLQTRHNIY